MLVFLDTEFSDFKNPQLISLALVTEDGREFYAEQTDFVQEDCSEFVRENVLPLLGRVPNAACTRCDLTERLHKWFEQLPEPATIIFDYETDWALLLDALLEKDVATPPANFGDHIHLGITSITHPVFVQAQEIVYTADWPKHHALVDARALMAGYHIWMAYHEQSWVDLGIEQAIKHIQG